ncbi:MAG: hypothetical protein HY280_05455 [Nitrospinae bacterium]|nr:hypothetical protein [Nitrospinota bacterium]
MRRTTGALFLFIIAFTLISAVDADAKKHRRAATARPAKKQAYSTGGGFQPATECAKCHSDVYRNWLTSHHAHSYDNPIFQAAYNKVYTETKGAAAKECLECHAPTTISTKDYDIKLDVTREGVTCDFCHSIPEANPEKNPSFKLSPGRVKITAGKPSKTEGHDVAFSEDFATSRLCAVCHDFSNKKGIHTEATYFEWKNSEYAKNGTECQNCHMMEIEAIATDKGGEGRRPHDHSFEYGVASPADAVTATVDYAVAEGGGLTAGVTVQNKNAGHYTPTGTPARGLVLEVSTTDGNGKIIETKKVVFSKEVLGADGREAESCADSYLNGCKAGRDNRLAPGETRHVAFSFSEKVKNAADVTARLYFLYRPMMIQQGEFKTPVSESSAKVARGPKRN